MRSRIEIVAEVSFQRPSQMPLSEHDHVVEALSANTADQAFREWILPWTECCSEDLLDAHSLNSVSVVATIHSVTVPYQIPRCGVLRKGFDDLLCRAFCRGMVGDVEMQHTATFMRND